ncbi:MAG: hypothetical protein ACFFCW_14085 [Candidatus Hodarchaeota archaeon]
MKNKYQKLQKDIDVLKAGLRRLEIRKVDAQDTVAQANEDIRNLSNELKGHLVNGNSEKAKTIEAKITKLREESVERNKILISGLDEKLSESKLKIAELEELKDKLFIELAEEWIQKEIGAYDDAAKRTIDIIRRLLCCYQLLRDIHCGETYTRKVGAGYDMLPRTRIPVLCDFDRTAYINNYVIHGGTHVYETVKREITRGG